MKKILLLLGILNSICAFAVDYNLTMPSFTSKSPALQSNAHAQPKTTSRGIDGHRHKSIHSNYQSHYPAI